MRPDPVLSARTFTVIACKKNILIVRFLAFLGGCVRTAFLCARTKTLIVRPNGLVFQIIFSSSSPIFSFFYFLLFHSRISSPTKPHFCTSCSLSNPHFFTIFPQITHQIHYFFYSNTQFHQLLSQKPPKHSFSDFPKLRFQPHISQFHKFGDFRAL